MKVPEGGLRPLLKVSKRSIRKYFKHLAMMEAQLILATIAQRYWLRLVPGHPIEPQALITLRPRQGVLVTLHERC